MSKKWIKPAVGLLAAVLTYMLMSDDSLGMVGLLTFAGTFAVVWVGLDYMILKTGQGQPGKDFSPGDAT